MWIVLGDATSSGGQVVSGSPFTDIDGKPVARVNDKATCPTHKGTFPIVDGDPTTIIDGEAVALHGSALACGCKVLAVQQVRVLQQVGGGGAGTRGSGSGPVAGGTVASSQSDVYSEAFVLRSAETGKALCNRDYRITTEAGEIIEGRTDQEGRTALVTTRERQLVRVELGEEIPA
ncbi:PAAR domain-containing protein [Novilysobacter arseniciresistens]|uniref:PAAR domain-containing protein n=1 Tax=Novilysobacter arseniciresistens TaxID=1385522 RepID=UPI0009DD3576|nr:PAAR domain-containing protein [Lysobacter arseniciresistens]